MAEPLDLPVAEVLALGQAAYADRASFERVLQARMPSVVFDAGGQVASVEDPFLWSLAGRFGGAGASPRPGAIFGCARYGVATRDLFLEYGFAAPETFALMGDALPLSDDVEVWPNAAVARLHCIFVWDDAETVRIVPEPAAQAALGHLFEAVTAQQEGSDFAVLGEDGFRLRGRNGAGDRVVWLESGDVILTNGHQQVSFRAYLIGGAV
ncbi:hypothetical protein [Gymnodinialimonas ulvae]|uniref:hypothetical protein n=1 Tax=Gymnodinialimonas ulvae TaxID=3126504 RepID=UPI0030EB8BB0